jgi:tRNA A-37 threonylcarbamoyl transferase component Bud32
MNTSNTSKTFKKNEVSAREAGMQLILSTSLLKDQTPKVHSYDTDNRILVMEKINQMSVSDMYGENMADVPKEVVDQIRDIISLLYYNSIEYPDITGYNFIETDSKVYIIDMEHAKFNTIAASYDPYILKFIKGEVTEWNTQFM